MLLFSPVNELESILDLNQSNNMLTWLSDINRKVHLVYVILRTFSFKTEKGTLSVHVIFIEVFHNHIYVLFIIFFKHLQNLALGTCTASQTVPTIYPTTVKKFFFFFFLVL